MKYSSLRRGARTLTRSAPPESGERPIADGARRIAPDASLRDVRQEIRNSLIQQRRALRDRIVKETDAYSETQRQVASEISSLRLQDAACCAALCDLERDARWEAIADRKRRLVIAKQRQGILSDRVVLRRSIQMLETRSRALASEFETLFRRLQEEFALMQLDLAELDPSLLESHSAIACAAHIEVPPEDGEAAREASSHESGVRESKEHARLHGMSKVAS